jgi:alpha-beta hydrolase superfamily lysophospholipase
LADDGGDIAPPRMSNGVPIGRIKPNLMVFSHTGAVMPTDAPPTVTSAVDDDRSHPAFHVGYYQLHPDVSLNFQLNRWVQWLGEDAVLADMRTVAPRIKDYADWKREFLHLAGKALAEGRTLPAAFYFRSAEFFMVPEDTDRRPARAQFLDLVRRGYAIEDTERYAVPYAGSTLPAYRFTPEHPKGTIVVFGGFDSYIEEFFPIAFFLLESGYDVVLFEGPGQGGALDDNGLPMTHAWERPVKAVLDYFGLADVTLLGISLGGGLAIRAAAFEPRIRRIIADDILFDFRECLFRQVHPILKAILKLLLAARAKALVNTLVRRAAIRKPVVAWGIRQGMHVLGVTTPYQFFTAAKRYTTRHVSARVTADVLLLAGSEDHYVPLHQFYQQAAALGNARSLTGRIFTRAERAQNHCQIGNIGLSLEVIIAWLNQIIGAPLGRSVQPRSTNT